MGRKARFKITAMCSKIKTSTTTKQEFD